LLLCAQGTDIETVVHVIAACLLRESGLKLRRLERSRVKTSSVIFTEFIISCRHINDANWHQLPAATVGLTT